MAKLQAKSRSLAKTNPYLRDPVLREALTVRAVDEANRSAGIHLGLEVIRAQYRQVQAELAAAGAQGRVPRIQP